MLITQLLVVASGSSGAAISIDNASIAENSAIGSFIGNLSVRNGSGSYTFSLTDDAGGLFALDAGDDTLLEVAGALDYETATSHVITVEADNGVDAPLSQDITIVIIDVLETGDDVGALLLTGVYGWA